MGADGMVADEAARQGLLDSLCHALCDGALPGELEEFEELERGEAGSGN